MMLWLLIVGLFLFSGCKEAVKPPNVAGAFYPSEPEVLSKMVDAFISGASPFQRNGQLIALISPHAGYQYSGHVAGYVYRNIDKNIKTVIIIGPSHYYSLRGISVYKEGFFRTPLGDVEIDKDIARALIDERNDIVFNPEIFQREHSIEVQIPFLQRTLKRFKIVPILVGSPTELSFRHVVYELTEVMRNRNDVLLIASSDLSHYHPYDDALKMDMRFIDAVERLSVEDLQGILSRNESEACGAWPVIITLIVARNLGATEGVLYKYANSGDVTGDKSRVVGYAAIGLYKTGLTKEQKELLLKIARDTVYTYVRESRIPSFHIKDKRLLANGATFVTLKDKNGLLRGCIGNIFPVMPLYESMIRNAVSASSSDPRFLPVRPDELDGLEIEVTVLSPLERIKDKRDIEIGRHGLFIVKDSHSGILLPQVPVEFGWDRDRFLKEVSLKAGLPEDAWKEGELYRFTAEIIK